MVIFTRKIIPLILLTVFIPIFSQGQFLRPKPKKFTNFWKDWAMGAQVGQTSFYGDVSLYDDNLTDKLAKESNLAYSIQINKKLTPILGLRGMVMKGGLKGSSIRSSFDAILYEYNVNVTLNLVNLLLPQNNAHFFLYGTLGIGHFLFDSKITNFGANGGTKREQSKVPEFVYLFGAGAYYILSPTVDITAEVVLRRAKNDKLDITVSNSDMDYYNYMGVGINYKFKNKTKSTRNLKKIKGRFPMLKRDNIVIPSKS